MTWSSSDPSVATVSKKGVVSAKKCTGTRTAVIRATSVSDPSVYAEQTITVRPLATSVALTAPTNKVDFKDGKTIRLSASCLPADSVQGIRWSTSDKKTATVSQDGLVTFLKQGTVTITAASGFSKKVKTTVKLTGGWLIKGLTITGPELIRARSSVQLKLEADPVGSEAAGVVWSTNNKRAKVDKQGKVTLVSSIPSGTVVTVTARDKLTGTVVATHSMQVYTAPTRLNITSGGGTAIPWEGSVKTVQLHALSSDGSRVALTWRSSDPSVATVDQNGLVTFHSAGSVSIHATSTDNTLIYNRIDLYAYDEAHPLPQVEASAPFTGTLDPVTLMVNGSTQLTGSVSSDNKVPISAVSVRVVGFSGIRLHSVCNAGTFSLELGSDPVFTLLATQLGNAIGTYTLQLYAEDADGKSWLLASTSATLQQEAWDINYLPVPNDLAADSPSTRVNNFIRVLMSQIGYREGPKESTKYAAYMGINHNPWCASFVSWCAKMAGVPESIIKPYTYANPSGICPNGTYYYFHTAKKMPKHSVESDQATFLPQRGDLIFFRKPGHPFAHIGVVLGTTGTQVIYIDGNGPPEQTVMVRRRALTDTYIAGYSRPNWNAN